VVAAGLVRGRYAPEIVSAEMRIMARSLWNILVFVLNSLIFILIGIQLSEVMERLAHHSTGKLLLFGAVISVVAIAIRFVWVFPAAYLPRGLSGRLHEQAPKPRRRELTLISWCGMRGIVSLAAALALPVALPNGQPFPARNLIIFLAFFVIAVTLIGQGLTLAPLIRRLKLVADCSILEEQQHMQSAMSAAAIATIDAHLADAGAPQEWADALRAEIAERVALTTPEGLEQTPRDEMLKQLRRVAIKAERKELIRLWRENEISDEVMRHQEEILDYQEAQL